MWADSPAFETQLLYHVTRSGFGRTAFRWRVSSEIWCCNGRGAERATRGSNACEKAAVADFDSSARAWRRMPQHCFQCTGKTGRVRFSGLYVAGIGYCWRFHSSRAGGLQGANGGQFLPWRRCKEEQERENRKMPDGGSE